MTVITSLWGCIVATLPAAFVMHRGVLSFGCGWSLLVCNVMQRCCSGSVTFCWQQCKLNACVQPTHQGCRLEQCHRDHRNKTQLQHQPASQPARALARRTNSNNRQHKPPPLKQHNTQAGELGVLPCAMQGAVSDASRSQRLVHSALQCRPDARILPWFKLRLHTGKRTTGVQAEEC